MPSDRGSGAPRAGERNERPIEDAVAACVERLTAGESIAPMEVLLEYPGIGHEVLESLETWIHAGEDELPRLRRLGDFTLLREAGRGGVGVVYEAKQESMDRRVALKVLPAAVAADRKAFLRFLREAQTAGKLRHPTIVQVHAMGVDAETPYYAMEFVEGETLAEIIARRREKRPTGAAGVLGAAEIDLHYYAGVARTFADVAEGLHHAHREGVIHRDIKPSNLIVDREGRLRIFDFGLAYREDLGSLTLTGDVVGTPLYMSPEQARREAIEIDHRTDVYSLGATLYEVLTLEPPFRGRDHQETLAQIIHRDARSLVSLDTRVPRDLETIVLKCLRKEPESRYGTAEALSQDLRRFVRAEPIEARPQSTWERWVRRAKRQRVTIGVVVGFLALFVAVGWLAHRQSVLEDERAALEIEKNAAAYGSVVLAASLKIFAGEFALKAGAGETRGLFRDSRMLRPEDLTRFLEQGAIRSLEEAEKALREMAQTVQDRLDAHYYLGRIRALLGRHHEAVEALRRVLARDPGFVPARVLLSQLEPEVQGPDGESPPTTDGAEWQRRWRLAHQAMQAKEWSRAEKAYGELLALRHREEEPYIGCSVQAYMGRGVARLGLDDFDGAREDFAVAGSLAPASLEPALFRAKANYLDGKEERSRGVFQDLYERAPADEKLETAMLIMAIHLSLGDYGEALAWANRLTHTPIGERLRASILLVLGRREGAIEAGRRAVALDPGDSEAHRVLAQALVSGHWFARGLTRAARLLEAIQVCTKGVELDPEDGDARSLLHAARAQLQSRFGRFFRRIAMNLKKLDTASWITALVLMFAPPAEAQTRFFDDLEDGDVFDDEPVSWVPLDQVLCGGGVCCQGTFEVDDGLIVRSANPRYPEAGLLLSEAFEGDVSVRTQVAFRGDGKAEIGFGVHVGAGCLNQYGAWLSTDGDMFILKWCGQPFPTVCGGSQGPRHNAVAGTRVDAVDRDSDYVLRFDTIGARLEFRAWKVGDPMPLEPQVEYEDPTPHRSGQLGLGYADRGFDGDYGIFRWFKVCQPTCEPTPAPAPFRRAETNGDGRVDLADGVQILGSLFDGGQSLECDDAADADDSGTVNVTDAVFLFNFLFAGGGAPPAPGTMECGEDPTEDELGCEVGCAG